MARKSRAEAQATREHILDTATEVFFSKGVARTSLEEIARAAGYTRGAIYGHFRNKADVFTAMINRIHLPMERLIQAGLAPDQEAAPLEHLRRLLEDLMRETAENPQRQKVLAVMFHKFEWTDEMASVKARKLEVIEEGRRCVMHLLERAMTQGELPGNLDTARAERILHAMAMGLISDWLFLPDNFDLGREGQALVDAYFDLLHHSPALRREAAPLPA